MKTKIGRWFYGDHSYYVAHITIGLVVMACTAGLIHCLFKQPIEVVLHLISDETISLSASLLGFQLAGVSILITSEGNKKLALLKEIKSDSMVVRVFLSSITMFLFSIVLMMISLNFFSTTDETLLYGKTYVDYASVVFFFFGLMFLFSSIRLLKWLYSK